MMGGLVDIAWLPVDIFTFVQGLKAGRLDTAEKIFHGIIIGTDVGVAVDGAISLTRALVPAAILKASRFATLFMGTSGAIMASLGAAFNLVNAMALVGLAIWQNFKTEQAFDRAGDRLDENLSNIPTTRRMITFRNFRLRPSGAARRERKRPGRNISTVCTSTTSRRSTGLPCARPTARGSRPRHDPLPKCRGGKRLSIG